MKIYFAAAISAGRKYADVYQKIVEFLKNERHEILTEHVADPNVLDLEKVIPDQEVYDRDIQLIKKADILIAEASLPSTGVGYEIAYMLSLKKPVICLYQRGLNMSKMITGNNEPLLSVYSYNSKADLVENLPTWIINHKNELDF